MSELLDDERSWLNMQNYSSIKQARQKQFLIKIFWYLIAPSVLLF